MSYLSNPSEQPFSITPSDSVNFSIRARGIYVGTSGNVVVVSPGGGTVTFSNVPAGYIIPAFAIRVNATSTTASDMVGMP